MTREQLHSKLREKAILADFVISDENIENIIDVAVEHCFVCGIGNSVTGVALVMADIGFGGMTTAELFEKVGTMGSVEKLEQVEYEEAITNVKRRSRLAKGSKGIPGFRNIGDIEDYPGQQEGD